MDQIFIKDLVVYGVIGVHDWERQKPQKILINVGLFTDLQEAGQSDNISDTIDYGIVAEEVRTLAERAGYFTVESLATDIAHLCMEISGAKSVRVRVEKPGAIQYARSAGVEIERSREE